MTANIVATPKIEAVNGVPVATSQNVARVFGKLHKNVLRDIDRITKQAPEFARLNFELCFENSDLQNGKPLRFYRMTERGFNMLAMGFTGAKAFQYKIAFLDAFYAMSEAIENMAAGTIQDAVSKLATLERERAKASDAGRTLSKWGHKKHALTLAFETAKGRCQLSLPLDLILVK